MYYFFAFGKQTAAVWNSISGFGFLLFIVISISAYQISSELDHSRRIYDVIAIFIWRPSAKLVLLQGSEWWTIQEVQLVVPASSAWSSNFYLINL